CCASGRREKRCDQEQDRPLRFLNRVHRTNSKDPQERSVSEQLLSLAKSFPSRSACSCQRRSKKEHQRLCYPVSARHLAFRSSCCEWGSAGQARLAVVRWRRADE